MASFAVAGPQPPFPHHYHPPSYAKSGGGTIPTPQLSPRQAQAVDRQAPPRFQQQPPQQQFRQPPQQQRPNAVPPPPPPPSAAPHQQQRQKSPQRAVQQQRPAAPSQQQQRGPAPPVQQQQLQKQQTTLQYPQRPQQIVKPAQQQQPAAPQQWQQQQQARPQPQHQRGPSPQRPAVPPQQQQQRPTAPQPQHHRPAALQQRSPSQPPPQRKTLNADVRYGNYPELVARKATDGAAVAQQQQTTARANWQQQRRNAMTPHERPITPFIPAGGQQEGGLQRSQHRVTFQQPLEQQPPRPRSVDPFGTAFVENATMETKVGGAQPKRVGRWTLAQLRQTDGIIPSQAGWNKGDSQKLMTNFGTPRNTATRVKAENLQEIPEEILLKGHGEVRLQSGTNRFASQKGMTNFGTGRDVCREGVHVNTLPADLEPLPEEKIRASDGIVRLQAGTNKYDSQKGMTGFGTARRETTKMLDTKHPEYDHERPDQSEIPLQMGTNKFASQKNMMSFGTNRRETTKMIDTSHPDYSHESSIDASTIPYQMGSNQYASQKNMTCFGQGRWEVLDPSISWQNRKSQGMVRLQSGTNRFASQAGMTGFGTVRNTTYEAEAGELPYEDMKKSEGIIRSQAGWNKGDSQKGYTSFGAPRDVRGKHLKRIWELEYPEEAEVSLDRL